MEKLGDDIDGEAADDYSGYSVSLSADGTIVAIGAYIMMEMEVIVVMLKFINTMDRLGIDGC